MKFLSNFSKAFSNVKTRSLLVILGVILIIVTILVWTALREDPSQVLEEAAKTKRIRPIESLPGAGTPSVVYDPLQEQENVERAKEALDSGESQVARLLNQPPEGYGRGGLGFDDGTGRCGEECYDATGYDAEGYDRNGFDKDGYDRNGYDKDGYDKDGYDRQGYDRDGFDRNGCNRQGYDREGKLCAETVFGKDCFNQLGFDHNGCNREGLDPEGNACYGSDGFNAEGYDKCGYDRDGYDKDGFDRNGCNREGLDKEGKPCYNEEGFTEEGYNKLGFDAEGFDKNGLDKDGFNKSGCNAEGLNREGESCYDEAGYTEDGFDKQGFDKDGYDADGYDRQGYDRDGYDRDGFNRQGCNREGLNREGKPCIGGVAPEDEFGDLLQTTAPIDTSRAAAADYQRLLAEQQQMQAERMAELNAQQRAAALAEQQARLEAYEALMSAQAQGIVNAWAAPKQTYVKGEEWKEPEVKPTALTTASGLPPTGQGPLIHKAGDIVFAVIETSVNSDEPGPVLGKIVSGPLKGSKILGSFQRQEKNLYLQFSMLSAPDVPVTIGIDAVAVDPQTARTGVRSDVDNRYLLKYGTLLASAFLEGMGDAVLTSLGTPTLTDDSGAIIASQVVASGHDQVIAGLGKVGQKLGEEIDQSDIPPLVTLDSGTGVGLLFLQDLRIEESERELSYMGDKANQPAPGTQPVQGTPAQGTQPAQPGQSTQPVQEAPAGTTPSNGQQVAQPQQGS